jgi:hypothetical protein
MLGIADVFGEIGRDPALLAAVKAPLARLYADGARATVAAFA